MVCYSVYKWILMCLHHQSLDSENPGHKISHCSKVIQEMKLKYWGDIILSNQDEKHNFIHENNIIMKRY